MPDFARLTEMPRVPVSWGELLDKITILELKRDRLSDTRARTNVARELALLAETADARWEEVAGEIDALRAVNAALWDIEDAIREEDARGRFGPEFVALARAVYARNDERAGIKRRINAALDSALVEEKSYRGQPATAGA